MADLTEIPAKFNAGESVLYRFSSSDYPASDGWVCALFLNGGDPADPKKLDVTADVEDDEFIVELLPIDTALLSPGSYAAVHRFTLGDAVRDVVLGRVQVGVDVVGAAAGAMLSYAERQLAAVRAKISERIELDESSYTLLQRGAMREELAELRRLEADLVARVLAERRGGGAREPIRYRFRRAS